MRDKLEAAYTTAFGQSPKCDEWYADDIEAKHRGRHFSRLLDAEAWLDAVLMLVPEGCGVYVNRYWTANHNGPVWSAELVFGGIPSNPRRVHDAFDLPTPAEALLAAILAATNQENRHG